MKMKLAQRLLIGYYKTKLKTISLVSPRKAAEVAYQLFCTPYSRKSAVKVPPVFHKAESLSFEHDGLMLRGFRWQPEHPNGKKILIVHGFSSYAYKFEKYILPLKKEGFEVILFDAPGHGTSDGKLINAFIYKTAILRMEALYGPFYGLMGHSLGGLAATLAFEDLNNRQDRKLVLIAPATETETAIAHFFTLLPVDDKTKDAFTQLVVELAGKPVSFYSVSRVVKELHSPVLWVHDTHDTICPFEDVKPLLSLDLPHVQFLITEHLGHSKVYKDQNVCRRIVHFFSDGNS
ncbi:MAG: Serine aminopeptidase [Sediminibacterium sp.]|nr:Serine aminopeptidase [Sediminibacterium sp.]